MHTEIMREIKRLISEGEFRPGDKLPSEREMAAMMNCGRPAVREAVKALASVGLLRITPKGIFVNDGLRDEVLEPLSCTVIMSESDFAKLYEARIVIETGTVRLATERATPRDIEDLEVSLHRMLLALDEDAYYDEDVGFHALIARIADNPVLLTIITSLRGLLRAQIKAKVRRLSSHGMDEPRKVLENHRRLAYEQHKAIVEAMKARNAALAADLMREHIEAAQRTYLGL